MKKFQPDKLKPKSEKCVFIGYPKETIGYTFYHKSEGNLCCQEWKLSREGVSLERSEWEESRTDEVIVPSLELESSTLDKTVPVMPTPTREEANDDDHETSDQVSTEPHRSTRVRSAPEWYGNPVLEVMLLDHDEPVNYEEAMMSPDSAKWHEAIKSEI